MKKTNYSIAIVTLSILFIFSACDDSTPSLKNDVSKLNTSVKEANVDNINEEEQLVSMKIVKKEAPKTSVNSVLTSKSEKSVTTALKSAEATKSSPETTVKSEEHGVNDIKYNNDEQDYEYFIDVQEPESHSTQNETPKKEPDYQNAPASESPEPKSYPMSISEMAAYAESYFNSTNNGKFYWDYGLTIDNAGWGSPGHIARGTSIDDAKRWISNQIDAIYKDCGYGEGYPDEDFPVRIHFQEEFDEWEDGEIRIYGLFIN